MKQCVALPAPPRRRIAQLNIAKPAARQRRELVSTAARAIEVQRIDRDAERGVRNRAHHPCRIVHASERHPRDEFDVDSQVELLRRLAQPREAIGEARFVRIVAGREHMSRAQLGGRLEERRKCRQVGRRNEARSARIEHLDPRLAQARERFTSKRRLSSSGAGSRPGWPLRSRTPTNSNPASAASRTIAGGASSGTV
jgi:hypothetical protein